MEMPLSDELFLEVMDWLWVSLRVLRIPAIVVEQSESRTISANIQVEVLGTSRSNQLGCSNTLDDSPRRLQCLHDT